MKHFKNIKLFNASVAVMAATVQLSHGIITAGDTGGNGANVGEDTLVARYNDFAYWSNVVAMGAGTGIYLGREANVGYVLTANHLALIPSGEGIIGVNGKSYQVGSSRQIGSTDLRLYEVEVGFDAPDLPNVKIASANPALGQLMVAIGRGSRVQGADGDATTSDMISVNGMQVYQWAGTGALSWGENRVASVPIWLGSGSTATWTSSLGTTESTFFSTFDNPGSGNYLSSFESTAAAGDSGGPAFIYNDGEWELAGITSSVMYRANQPLSTSTWTNRTSYVNLAAYDSELPDFSGSAVPEPSGSLLVLLSGSLIMWMRRREKIQ